MRKQMRAWMMAGLAAAAVSGLAGCRSAEKPQQTTAAAAQQESGAKADKETSAAPSEAEKELKGELEIVTNADEATFQAVKQVFDRFMEENPGVTINFSSQGSDYEKLMKARMASNDLPDIFVTHGWSVARYSEYLRPLNDQPWYGEIEETFLSNIQNDEGQIFVLPINMDQGGILYNKKLLEELGAEVPKTWEEFKNICEMGKEKGYTGVFVAGKDSRNAAAVLNISAITHLVSCEDKNFGPQLKDGTFDWNNWTIVSQFLADLKSSGYLNVDCVTCDTVDTASRMAENNILFLITSSPTYIQQAEELNPDARYGMAPIPGLNDSYQPVFTGGEREAYGVWKDTKNEELCLAVLEYMAKADNIRPICEASGKRSALKDVNPVLGSVSEDYERYADVNIYPTFDRVYLPSGMWSTLKTVGSALIGEEMTVEESVKTMETDYKTLREQN